MKLSPLNYETWRPRHRLVQYSFDGSAFMTVLGINLRFRRTSDHLNNLAVVSQTSEMISLFTSSVVNDLFHFFLEGLLYRKSENQMGNTCLPVVRKQNMSLIKLGVPCLAEHLAKFDAELSCFIYACLACCSYTGAASRSLDRSLQP
jgi:hypothetical protein